MSLKKKNFTYGHLRKLLQLGNVCENARLYFLLKLLAKHFILVLMISDSTVNDLVYRTLFTWYKNNTAGRGILNLLGGKGVGGGGGSRRGGVPIKHHANFF